MHRDGYSGKKINQTWSTFSNGKSLDQIAFVMYTEFVGYGKEISKSIIAQYFARLLETDSSITREELEKQNTVLYLINAIKYATKQD